MIISELDYHLVIVFCIEDLYNDKIKEQLAIILPDIMLGLKGSVKKIRVTPEYAYINFSAGVNHSPKEIAETVITIASQRVVRLQTELAGFERIFNKDDYYISAGSKPSKRQIEDFISLTINGI